MYHETLTGERAVDTGTAHARDLYFLLLESSDDTARLRESRRFLEEHLERASALAHDFPSDPPSLEGWMERRALDAGARYAEYLEGRRQGGPRRLFSNKAHALSFLQHVAPTKLVDGAWLYGILPYWKDPRFHGLVRTYLEELGDGDPRQNHVVLYQRLLAANGCEMLPPLSDELYVRGTVQLSFALHAERFLPELIGYNLGYEQLPLHLPISAFELGELDIDPYYFTLHITADNAGTGHARRAVQAVKACMPVAGDTTAFWQRVVNGYQLNDVGPGVQNIIDGFDLEEEVILMLERKRPFGQHLHSDFSRFGGRTVNEWLSAPGQMREFLGALESRRWIVRHEDPRQSRFWGLVEGPKAPMAGVFDGFEKQLLHDWIAGDWLARESSAPRRAFRRFRDSAASGEVEAWRGQDGKGFQEDRDPDVNALRRELLYLDGARRMRHLIDFMSPAKHHTPAGLLATREFVATMNGRQP